MHRLAPTSLALMFALACTREPVAARSDVVTTSVTPGPTPGTTPGPTPPLAPAQPGPICSGAGVQLVPQLSPHAVLSGALTLDGKRIAAVTDDGLITIVDVASGAQLAHIPGDGARFGQDGASLFVQRGASIVRMSVPELQVAAVFAAGPRVGELVVDAATTKIVGAGFQQLAVWDAKTGALRCQVEHPAIGMGLAITSDGARAWTCRDEQLAQWDTDTCSVVATGALLGSCMTLAVGPDGARLVVNSRKITRPSEDFIGGERTDRSEIWDAAALTRIGQREEIGDRGALMFAPDGRTVYVPMRYESGLGKWNIDTDEVTPLSVAIPIEVHMISSTPDRSHVLLGGRSTREADQAQRFPPDLLRVYTLPDGRDVGGLTPGPTLVQPARVLPHGESFFTIETDNIENQIRRVTDWTALRPKPFGLGFNFEFSPDGGLLTDHRDDELALLETRTGKLRGTFPGKFSQLDRFMFSHDGARLLAIGRDGVHTLIDAVALDEIKVLRGSPKDPQDYGAPPGADLSPDGARVLVRDKDRIVVWDVASGESVPVGVAGAQWLARPWSGDGTRVALRNGTAIVVHDARTGAELGRIEGLGEAVLSNDGSRVAGITSGGALRVQHVTGQSQILIAAGVSHLQRAPDGTLIAAAGATFSAWDLASGARLSEISAPERARVVRLADGRWLAVYGQALHVHAASGELLATRIQTRDNVWAAWSNDGRWDGSEGAEKLLIAVDRLTSCGAPGPRHAGLWEQAVTGALPRKSP